MRGFNLKFHIIQQRTRTKKTSPAHVPGFVRNVFIAQIMPHALFPAYATS